MLLAVGDDEVLLGSENVQLGQAPRPVSLEGHVLQTARRDPVCSLPSSSKASSFWRSSKSPASIICNTQHLMHDMRECWRNQGDSACTASRNNSKMLPKHINGYRMKKCKLQLILLQVVEHRK